MTAFPGGVIFTGDTAYPVMLLPYTDTRRGIYTPRSS